MCFSDPVPLLCKKKLNKEQDTADAKDGHHEKLWNITKNSRNKTGYKPNQRNDDPWNEYRPRSFYKSDRNFSSNLQLQAKQNQKKTVYTFLIVGQCACSNRQQHGTDYDHYHAKGQEKNNFQGKVCLFG